VFAIHVENLVKTYDSRRVLDGVNLDVVEGEFYALQLEARAINQHQSSHSRLEL
jgi:ABC-type lipopolysaccharide export system ATPase subunit